MARYGINFDLVANAASQLLAKDIDPTVNQVRRFLGTGSKTAISKHLRRWRFQRQQAQDDSCLEQTPPQHSLNASSQSSETMHDECFRNHLILPTPSSDKQLLFIQRYVADLEAELAELNTQQHRLAQRFMRLYPSEKTSDQHINRKEPLADIQKHLLCDPSVFASPLLEELQYILTTLSYPTSNNTSNNTSKKTDQQNQKSDHQDDDTMKNASVQTVLQRASLDRDTSAIREAALRAENTALRAQIKQLRRVLLRRQVHIERLENDLHDARTQNHQSYTALDTRDDSIYPKKKRHQKSSTSTFS